LTERFGDRTLEPRIMIAMALRLARLTLVAFLTFQGSGVGQLVAAATAESCCTPCEAETEEAGADDERCPPLCPTCSCGHARRPTIVPLATQHQPLVRLALTAAPAVAGRLPDSPDPRGIFHPPRA
jgi:hypothetical protein